MYQIAESLCSQSYKPVFILAKERKIESCIFFFVVYNLLILFSVLALTLIIIDDFKHQFQWKKFTEHINNQVSNNQVQVGKTWM